MKTFLLRMALSWAALALVGAASGAQGQAAGQATAQADDEHGLRVREIHPKATASPFPLDARTGRVQELEFRAPEQMTAADRSLAEANEGEIARRAELQGFHFGSGGDGGWGYEQAVCPAFPDHLILEYSRGEGAGDATLFSVAIPRGGEGHVRVIPVRRRGYSLWTPASSNALTLNDFNHMVKEGGNGLSHDSHPSGVDLPLGTPDWLTLGLCYAALAGGHVRAALVALTPQEQVYPMLTPAMLKVSGKGGAVVRFADATPHVKQMDWVMTFAQNGRLMQVKHTPSQAIVERPLRIAASTK
jgi:hypothetical protein